ncbi:MAG: PAS domain S-box protein [Anaerolineales bacterium]|nr:PAS domain S-box protein [Anaerolineales bacterium]
MNFEYSAYILPLIAAAVTAMVTAIYAWGRRTANGAVALFLLSLAIFIWSFGYSLEIAGTTLETKYAWGVFQYFGIAFAPYAWLIFSFTFSNEGKSVSKRLVLLTAVIPTITVLLTATTKWNGLIWSEYHIDQQPGFSALGVSHGTWWFIHFAYSYLSLFIGTILIIRSMLRRKGMYRGQAVSLIIAVLAPWIGNALYLTGNSPIAYLDLTPFAFTVTMIALAWAIFGFHLVDIAPIARELIIDSMQDGMIVIDVRGTVVDINNAAARMIGVPISDAIGKNAGELFTPWPHLIERFRNVMEANEEITVGTGSATRKYEVRLSPLRDQQEKVVGRVVLLRLLDDAFSSPPKTSPREITPRVFPSLDIQRASEASEGFVGLLKDFFLTPTKVDLEIPDEMNPSWYQARERSFTIITRIAALIGTIAYILTLPIIRATAATNINFTYGIVVAVLWFLGLARTINFRYRAYLFLFLVYVLGFVETQNFGYSVESFVFFLTFIITAVLLTGRSGGWAAAAMSILTLLAFNWFIHEKGFTPYHLTTTSLSPRNFETGLTSLSVFTASALALSTSITILMESLNRAWKSESQASNLLEQERDLLEQRVEERTRDLAKARDEAVQEISERKRTQGLLQESEARFRQIVENASDLIYRTDERGNLTYINPTSMRIMGISHENEILGTNYVEIASPEWRHRLKRFYEKQFYRQEEGTYFEFQAQTFSGEEIWLGQNVQIIREGDKITGFQAVARNITELKRTQEALLVARDQALDASRLKSQLLSRVSHELRTPLGGILGYAELLQFKTFGELSDKQRNAVDNIVQSTNYLANIVNDLLDEAQIESRSISLNNEYFSPGELLEKVNTSILVLASNKGLELKTDISSELPSELYGDLKRLQQVVINLAGNAIKFTQTGEISINLKRPTPTQWAIEVKDTGSGISPEEHQNIFEPFRQVNNSITRENRGSGLGLAITKQLIELMDGQITLESNLGQGSTFTVLLPIKNAPGE